MDAKAGQSYPKSAKLSHNRLTSIEIGRNSRQIEHSPLTVVFTPMMSPYSTHNHYQPGSCNIGTPELRVRKLFLRIFSVATLFLTAGSIIWAHSVIIWSLMLFVSFSAIVLFFEIRYRFCILFGFFNLSNFKQLGHLEEVKDHNHIRKDRKRVAEILVKSFCFALVYATAVHLMIEKVHGH
jgi:hypothetical protein